MPGAGTGASPYRKGLEQKGLSVITHEAGEEGGNCCPWGVCSHMPVGEGFPWKFVTVGLQLVPVPGLEAGGGRNWEAWHAPALGSVPVGLG